MDSKFVLPKITVEEEELNGRDDQHVYYRVLRDGEPISGWIEWSEACEIMLKETRRVEIEDPLWPEERRVLELVDELAAVQERLDEARRQVRLCRHVAVTKALLHDSPQFKITGRRCNVCCATGTDGGPWLPHKEKE